MTAPSPRTCSKPNCSEKHLAKGLCKVHYRLENKEASQQRHKDYYVKNRERILGKNKKYQSENKGKIKKRYKVYYEENKEQILEKERTRARSTPKRISLGRQSAKKRGLSWTITKEQFEILSIQPCHYCGGKLPEVGTGLDRVDNSRGYELDNVVPACRNCNVLRSDLLSPEEVKSLIEHLRQLRKTEGTPWEK